MPISNVMERTSVITDGTRCTTYGVLRHRTATSLTFLIIEVPENTGLSITNAIEAIVAAEFAREVHLTQTTQAALHDKNLYCFEHYPSKPGYPDVYDEVRLKLQFLPNPATGLYRLTFSDPTWHPVSKLYVLHHLGIL